VYAAEVEEMLPESLAGTGVALVDARKRPLGMGIYNPQSKIVWRRYSRGPGIAWDAEWGERALQRAVARRSEAERYQRLVWSEADGLPGVVVDRYGGVLVVQALTLGAERILPSLLDGLGRRFDPSEIIIRNDAPSRRLEGLDAEVRTLSGRALPAAWHRIDEVAYWLDLEHAQKTGFYLDQRVQHRLIGARANGKRVLDLFCNQGAFALQAAAAGAREVVALDSSDAAIALAQRNAERAGASVHWVVDNAFDWLTANAADERFDLIVLDPPSFAPNRRAVEGALRGHKQLHLRALQMLAPGGQLATYSCSQQIGRERFYETLESAARDVGREVRILEETGQPADHPVLLGFPESAYLKGLIVAAD